MGVPRPPGRGRNTDALLVGRGGSIRSLAGRVTADNIRVHCYPHKEFNGTGDIGGNVSDAVRVVDINALAPDTDFNHPGEVGYFVAVNTGFYESQDNSALMSGGIHVGGVYSFKDIGSLVGSQYESVFTITNTPGYSINLPATASFATGAIYRGQGGNASTITADIADFQSGVVVGTSADGVSTLTATRVVNFSALTLVGIGGTVTERIGYRVADVLATNLGTVTTQIGVEIPVLRFAAENHAVRVGYSSTTIPDFTTSIGGAVVQLWPSTYTADFASATFPRMVDVGGTFQYKQSASGLLAFVGVGVAPTVQNEATTSSNLGNTVAYYAGVTHQANVNAVNGGSMIDLLSNQQFAVGTTGSFTAVSGYTVQSQMTVGAGAVVTERRGFSYSDKGGAGTLTTQYAVFVPALSGAGTNWGVYCLADVLLGADVYGATTSGGNLILRSTTSATKGYVVAADSVKVFSADRTYTAIAAEPIVQVDSARTLTSSSSGTPTLPSMIDFNPALVLAVAGGSNPVLGFRMRPTVTNSSTGSWSTGNLGRGFVDNTTFNITSTQTGVTVGTYLSFRASPSFTNNSAGVAGTATLAAWASFSAGAPGVASATGWTVTTWRHFEITDTASALIGTQIGVEIPVLTAATTANIGLRNASTTVLAPTTQTITAVGNTIAHTASNIRLNNTSGSSKTLTSAPTISDGQDGEIVVITNTSASDVVLQDQGTLASSNLRLGASSRTLSTRDSLMLKYDGTVGDWIELVFSNVI